MSLVDLCWTPPGRTKVWFMTQLPAAYAEYLQGKTEAFVDTIMPVLLQSVAENTHGVHVVISAHVVQAHTDATIPFGEILEAAD